MLYLFNLSNNNYIVIVFQVGVIYQMRRISAVLRLDDSGSRRKGRHCFGCWCYLFITLGGSTIYIY